MNFHLNFLILSIWYSILGLWILIPLIKRGKSFRTSTKRLPVWISISIIECLSLITQLNHLFTTVVIGAVCIGIWELYHLWRNIVKVLIPVFLVGVIASLTGEEQLALVMFLLQVSIIVMIFALDYRYRSAGGILFSASHAVVLVVWLSTLFWDHYELTVLIASLLIIHLTDISAGFIGKIGKRHPFYTLSPNKTVIGYLGSLITILVVSSLLFVLSGVFSFLSALIYGFIIWLTASAGDLSASKVKRMFETKDFSKTLGPHGGIIDRIDSLFLSSCFAILWITLLL
jgi:phosphatidate cytidylyltransferase